MIIWEQFSQYLELALSCVLIVRILALRLQRVYRVFCAFLVANLISSLIWLFEAQLYDAALRAGLHLDYRLTWMAERVVMWALALWTVYALLDAILVNLPGIRMFSRRLLNVLFGVALGLGVLSAFPEYSAVGWVTGTGINHLLAISIVLDRAIASAALLVLVGMLMFLLWFPIEISRNLAIFSAGFVVYFAAKTALLLSRSIWSHESLRIVSTAITIVSSACLAYWAIFISAAGEHAQARLSQWWHSKDQDRLLGEIEAISASLLRTVRR